MPCLFHVNLAMTFTPTRAAALLLALALIPPPATALGNAERRRYEAILTEQHPDLRLIRPDEFSEEAIRDFTSDDLPPLPPGLNPVTLDFNGDGRRDFAALLVHRRTNHEREGKARSKNDFSSVYLALCLARPRRGFDCHIAAERTDHPANRPGWRSTVVMWKTPPQKDRLSLGFVVTALRTRASDYQTWKKPEDPDWTANPSLYGITLVSTAELESWGLPADTFPHYYLHQRFEGIDIGQLLGHAFRFIWIPSLGIVDCCWLH